MTLRNIINITNIIRNNPYKVVSINKLAKELGINWRTAKQSLEFIDKKGFLQTPICVECHDREQHKEIYGE